MKLLNEDLFTVESLRQDHALLCGELAVLEKAKSTEGSDLWQTLQDVCVRLSLGLREHIRREGQLLVTRNHSLGAAASEAMSRLLIDHYGDFRYLQVITRCVAIENRPFLLESRYQLLTDFLRGLHRHMDQQEAELFPGGDLATI